MASFEDAKGRKWTMTLSAGVLKRFEKKTSKKILRTLSKAIGSAGDDAGDKMIGAFGEVLEDFDSLTTLAYMCSAPDDEQDKPSLDDFCDALSGPALGKAAVALIEALTDCMSAMQGISALAGATGSDPK